MNPFASRKYIIGGIFSLLFIIYIGRLFFLQVVDQSYKLSASNNVLRYVTQYPNRGLIYDRNNELLVYNEVAYDLLVIPNQLTSFDTVEMCEILGLTKEQVLSRLKKAKRYSRYKSSIFQKQISAKTFAPFQEKLYMYKGFYVETRTLRKYPRPIASHALGYVGEVNDRIAKGDNYYNPGDYIGISGTEKSYEKVLRGKKGVEVFMVDVHNRIKGRYKNGKYDTAAIHGDNITLTIDAALQEYGEYLMTNKIGSIVAIEPSTGELLAMVSSPGYDPALLVGRERTSKYSNLQNDTLKSLLNRPLQAWYPPGSTFKMITAIIGLKENIIWPNTEFGCLPGYAAGRFYMGCHRHDNPLNLAQSIQHSCNAYYATTFRALLDHPKYGGVYGGFDVWRDHVLSFGFGKKLGVDLPNEINGYIPTKSYYNRIYGNGHLRSLNIVSLAIGQGELLMTPVQLANMTAAIANRGHFYTPHIIKDLPDVYSELKMPFLVQRYTNFDSTYFPTIIEGMYLAVHGGPGSTSRGADVPGLEVCGKTGTAQNPHGENHSIFVCFAPKDDPKIALAVYVENGGSGARWAVPMARLLLEKYFKVEKKNLYLENYIVNANLLNVEKKE